MNFAFAAAAGPAAVLRDSNSEVVTRRGVKAYAARQYGPAVDAFTKANACRSSPATLFNLGTARIAAGKREEGSAALTQAMADPKLRADALYNRGNSALAAGAYDYAIRDYTATLKLRPGDFAAKRNLEIALQRRQQQQESTRNGQQQGSQQQQQQQKEQQSPSSGNKQQQPPQQPKGDANADALLRAVQQQEQEELSRMKRARAARGRVGW